MSEDGWWNGIVPVTLGTVEQAHAMSNPEADIGQRIEEINADIRRSIELAFGLPEQEGWIKAWGMQDVQGVQHVSQAAMAIYAQRWGVGAELVEKDLADAGLIMRTVAEWQDLESYKRAYESEVVLSSNRWGDLGKAQDEIQRLSAEIAARTDAWDGIEFALREENRKLRCEIERMRKERGDVREPSMGTNLGRATADRMELAGRLTLLPEPDNRLGRGNFVMDADNAPA